MKKVSIPIIIYLISVGSLRLALRNHLLFFSFVFSAILSQSAGGCRGIVPSFIPLDLEGSEAQRVFRHVWASSWDRYLDLRDQYWEEALKADEKGDSGTVYLRLNDIVALQRAMWVHHSQNPSATGTLRTSYRYIREKSALFKSMGSSEKEIFWEDRSSIARVPATQIRDFVIQVLKVADQERRWIVCLNNMLVEMRMSAYVPLKIEGEKLLSPTHPHPPEVAELIRSWNLI